MVATARRRCAASTLRTSAQAVAKVGFLPFPTEAVPGPRPTFLSYAGNSCSYRFATANEAVACARHLGIKPRSVGASPEQVRLLRAEGQAHLTATLEHGIL